MTNKELEKRIQEIRDYFGDSENFEGIENEYLELIYDLLEKNKKEDNDDRK